MVEATNGATFKLSSVQQEYRTNLLTKLASAQYHLEDVLACPCGSTDARPLASHDRFGLPIGVVLCGRCGLARSTPRLSTADLPDFYQNYYHGLHMSLPDPDPSTALVRRGQGATIFALLRDQLPSGPLRVAEIGAATGQVLREFAEAAGGDVTAAGCEYASAYVEAGRSIGTDMRRGGPESQGEQQQPKPDPTNAEAVMNGLRALESWPNRIRQGKLLLTLYAQGARRRLKLLWKGRVRDAVS